MQGLIHSFRSVALDIRQRIPFLIQRAGKARSGGQATRLFPQCAREGPERWRDDPVWMGPLARGPLLPRSRTPRSLRAT